MSAEILSAQVARECPLCRLAQFEYFKKLGEWRLVRCRVCKLVMLNPQPTPEGVAQAYNSPDYFSARIQQTPSPEVAKRRVELLSSEVHHLLSDRPTGRILEIGSGYGLLLAAAKRKGWVAVGVEISTHAANFARETFDLDIMRASAEDLELLNVGRFDAVVMSSVIEHLSQPLVVLRAVRKILNPRGVLFAVVPNVASFDRWWHGSQWSGWDVPFHLWHFTPSTITKLLRQAGFDEVGVEKRFFDPISHIRVGLKLKDFRADKPSWQVFQPRDGTVPCAGAQTRWPTGAAFRRTIKHVFSGRDMKVWAR